MPTQDRVIQQGDTVLLHRLVMEPSFESPEYAFGYTHNMGTGLKVAWEIDAGTRAVTGAIIYPAGKSWNNPDNADGYYQGQTAVDLSAALGFTERGRLRSSKVSRGDDGR